MQGRKQPAGATLPTEAVDIRLTGHADIGLPEEDAGFSRQIVALLGEYADRYGISVLDMTNPDELRYAEHHGGVTRNPGSVGKILVAMAIWQALADLYPDDTARRWQLLKDTEIVADEFIISDSHTVRRWDRDSETLIRRPLQVGDRGSMMEYMDWMLSFR